MLSKLLLDEGADHRTDIHGAQRPESERPPVTELLTERMRNAALLQGPNVSLGSLVSGKSLEACVKPVASVVHRPDRQPVRHRTALHGQVALAHARDIDGDRE